MIGEMQCTLPKCHLNYPLKSTYLVYSKHVITLIIFNFFGKNIYFHIYIYISQMN